MPTYFFNVKTDQGTITDTDGTDLPDQASARSYAEIVARELMAHREPQTRSWRLDVRDSDGLPCFDLLFATLDGSLGHLTPELRSAVESLCASSGSIAEAIRETKLTLLEVKATIARAEGALYLAAVNGAAVRSQTDHKPGRCP
jgi:Domain of unknown function (DUF6894)